MGKSTAERFNKALTEIDREHSKDPNKEEFRGKKHPKELLYAQRMTDWLVKIEPKASEALQLAARSQHICRWTKPREAFPMDRKGYLRWRTELKNFHASKASDILEACGYDSSTMDRVKALILKKNMKSDSESQLLEDVVCLVFLEYYFQDFSKKHSHEKVMGIVQKTWRKMSEKGRDLALNLDLPPTSRGLIQQAMEM